ncbi:MAG TPA: hypothetical protein VFR42_00440 [Candidatus Acidoferrum sp.]|nr:hypothetical protein [Candidatus Acidoferrum sp.]
MKLRVVLPGLCALLLAGCHQHPLTDYRPLDQAGMWSSGLEDLKKLDTSDSEVAQLVKVKQARLSDDACVALVAAAHERKHPFVSGDSTANLAAAGYTEDQILEIAKADQLDAISGDAVALRLIGLSDGFVQFVLKRRLQKIPTLDTPQIARLKNTGLTEAQIMEKIKAGMTDAQADREVTVREANRNHAGTGFVRVHGRKPR